jgi:hypothetical protein
MIMDFGVGRTLGKTSWKNLPGKFLLVENLKYGKIWGGARAG